MRKNNIKSTASWFGVIILAIIRAAALGVVISGFFCFTKWIGSLLSWCKHPSWIDFFGGWIGIFAFIFLLYLIGIIKHIVRCKKDPVFKDMSEKAGIQWEDYKKLKGL